MKELPQEEKKDEAFFPITVAVVTYNHGKKLKDCIDSIAKQTYQHIDLVIVDDFSCDFDQHEVEKYINDLNSKSIQSLTVEAFGEHRGVNAAYRCALESAKGEYILFLSGDDLLAKKTVVETVAQKLSEETVDVLQGKAKLIREGENVVIPSQQCMEFVQANKMFDLFRVTIYHPFAQLLCIQSAFFRTDYLREIDAFSCDYQFAVDWPLFTKMLFKKAVFFDSDLMVTHMLDNGAYKANGVGNLYIKKGYLYDAARAIREYAITNRPEISQEEALLFETAANSYECMVTKVYDWYYYSISDKRAWKKEHRNYFLMHKACYPNYGFRSISVKKILTAIFAVFVLFATSTMLPTEFTVLKPQTVFVLIMAVAGLLLLHNKNKTGQFIPNLNYKKLAALLLGLTVLTAAVKTVESISVRNILLLILGGLILVAASVLAYGVVYKMYCRYARRVCRKG